MCSSAWWGVLVVLFRSSEAFYFSSAGTLNIRKRKSGVLHSSVIFRTSNKQVFLTSLPSVMSERRLVLTPSKTQESSCSNKWPKQESRGVI